MTVTVNLLSRTRTMRFHWDEEQQRWVKVSDTGWRKNVRLEDDEQ